MAGKCRLAARLTASAWSPESVLGHAPIVPKFQLITVRAALRILIWSSGFLCCADASATNPAPTLNATAAAKKFFFIPAPFTSVGQTSLQESAPILHRLRPKHNQALRA
jgi:hypothetical protein